MGVPLRPRGLTLAELLVTAAVFAALLVIVVGLQLSMARLNRQEDQRDLARRNVIVAMSHVGSLLGRSRVSAPAPGSPAAGQADLRVPAASGQTAPNGEPVLEDHQLRLDAGGNLQLIGPAGSRRLASLGAAGTVELEWLPSGLLRVRVVYARQSGVPLGEAVQEFVVPNQG